MSWTSLRPAHRIDALVKKPARRRPNATPAGSRRVSAVANSGTYVGFRGKNGRVNCRGRLPKVTHSRPERLQHRCWSRVCRAEIQDVAASPENGTNGSKRARPHCFGEPTFSDRRYRQRSTTRVRRLSVSFEQAVVGPPVAKGLFGHSGAAHEPSVLRSMQDPTTKSQSDDARPAPSHGAQ
jgi:hypothetical protein